MPDSPDYSKYQLGSVRFSLQDVGELAVRLGSVDWYERLGNVVFIDDMSHGIAPYVVTATGAGSSVTVLPNSDTGPGYTLRFHSAAVPNPSCSIQKYLAPFEVGKHSAEWSCAFINTFSYMTASLVKVVDNVHLFTSIQYTLAGNVLKLTNDAGVLETLPITYIPFPAPNLYQHFKLVADFDRAVYSKLMINGDSYDLTSHAMRTFVAPTADYEVFLLEVGGSGAAVSDTNIGLVILTTGEP